jgi:hypothetical protein
MFLLIELNFVVLLTTVSCNILKILFKKDYVFTGLNNLIFDALTLYIFIKTSYLRFLKSISITLVSIVFAFDNYNYRKKLIYYKLICEESNTQPYEKNEFLNNCRVIHIYMINKFWPHLLKFLFGATTYGCLA